MTIGPLVVSIGKDIVHKTIYRSYKRTVQLSIVKKRGRLSGQQLLQKFEMAVKFNTESDFQFRKSKSMQRSGAEAIRTQIQNGK